MLRFASKLTQAPSTMTDADAQGLRSAGHSDDDILRVVQVTGYFAFVNRLADGLGVELEPENDGE
jgi:uncharacterized protein YciW